MFSDESDCDQLFLITKIVKHMLDCSIDKLVSVDVIMYNKIRKRNNSTVMFVLVIYILVYLKVRIYMQVCTMLISISYAL